MNVTEEDIDEIYEKAEDRIGVYIRKDEDSGNHHAIMLMLAVLEWYEENHEN